MNQPLGFLYILAVPLAAGLATLRGVSVGGFSYTGWLWICLLASGLLLLGIEKGRRPDIRIAFPLRPWLVWFGLVWLSLVWSEGARGKNVQDAMQISMPLVVGAAAAMFVTSETQLTMLMRCFRIALLPIAACVAAVFFGVLDGGATTSRVTVGVRVLSTTTVLIACVFLADFPRHRWRPLLGWGVCVLFAAVTGSRMAALATVLLPAFHPLVRGWHWRAIMVLLLMAAAMTLFYTPMFQERFFYTGSGDLTDLLGDDMRSSGRFTAWPLIYDRAWRHPLFGAGVGSISSFVPTVWSESAHAHNDYLRIGFELGVVGLGIFLTVVVWQAHQLRIEIAQSTGPTRRAFAAVWLGFAGFLILAISDNPLVYNLWYMNPLFALLGAAYGVAGNGEGRELSRTDEPPPTGLGAFDATNGWSRRRLSTGK